MIPFYKKLTANKMKQLFFFVNLRAKSNRNNLKHKAYENLFKLWS